MVLLIEGVSNLCWGTVLTDSLAALPMLWGGGKRTFLTRLLWPGLWGIHLQIVYRKRRLWRMMHQRELYAGHSKLHCADPSTKEEFLNWYVDVVSQK